MNAKIKKTYVPNKWAFFWTYRGMVVTREYLYRKAFSK